MGLTGFIIKKMDEKKIIKQKKNPGRLFYKLPVKQHSQFSPIGLKLAGLAVLFSKQLLNGSQDLFCFNILIVIYFFRYETIETHACAILPLSISAVGSVSWLTSYTNSFVSVNSCQGLSINESWGEKYYNIKFLLTDKGNYPAPTKDCTYQLFDLISEVFVENAIAKYSSGKFFQSVPK